MSSKVEIEKIYALTPMQEGMLFHSMLHKDSEAYFEQTTLTMKGTLNLSHFDKSLNELIQRYEVFRAIFNYKKLDKPIQIILKKRLAKVGYHDISYLTEEEQRTFLSTLKLQDREKGFDLTKDLLMRVTIVQMAMESYEVIWSHHHILMDGWCLGIVLQEWLQIYRAYDQGIEINLPPVVPYSRFIQWLEKQDKEQASDYWHTYLQGYELSAQIPGKSNRVDQDDFVLEEYEFTIEEQLTNQLQRISSAHQITINTILQSVWGLLLQAYNNTDDVVFGAVVSGRPAEIAHIESMVGLFINTLPVRVQGLGERTVLELFQHVQRSSLESEQYSYYPLYEIQNNHTLKQHLFDHILIFENYPVSKMLEGERTEEQNFHITNMEVFEQTQYPFAMIIVPGQQLRIKFAYNGFIYNKDTVRRMEGHLKTIMACVLENPQLPISGVKLVTEVEQQQILLAFNNTKKRYSRNKTVQQLFEEQVKIRPDQVAVVFENEQLTYRELDERSNQLAHGLRERGVTADTVVGLMADRSLEMFIGIYGILKSGGAYLPMDPEYPQDRLDYMLQDSGAKLVLTHTSKAVIVSAENIQLSDNRLYSHSKAALAPLTKSTSLAYVIYTSGSTGKPKGVMIVHQALTNLLAGLKNEISFPAGESMLTLTSISFDIFVVESLIPLAMGMTLVAPAQERERDLRSLTTFVTEHPVKMMQLTPSRLRMLLEGQCYEPLRQLSTILIGGEAFPVDLLHELQSMTKARIYNMYGPTETTVWSAVKELTDLEDVVIGKPIANTHMYVLDRSDRLQPIGVVGELCIAGDGLARGYWNRSDLTNEKFVVDPFKVKSKMYRTGDLAMWMPDGNLAYMGRMDHQVKIRGYRIELGEIEVSLRQHPSIREAVVIALEDENRSPYLSAYVVADEELTTAQFREHVLVTLPSYMIPSYFIRLAHIPLTPNGKIDRKALPEPTSEVQSGDSYEGPRDEIEAKLAEVWQEVLGIGRVDRHDHFFEMGGHSLKAMVLVSRIHKVIGIEVSLREVFEYPSIAQMGQHIQGAEREQYVAIPVVDERVYYPASSAQQRMFILNQLEGQGIQYNMPAVLQVEGKLDSVQFNKAFQQLINRHEILRTSFQFQEGLAVQYIHREAILSIEHVYALAHEWPNIMNAFVRPFDLSEAPLLRVKLVHLTDESHVLLVDMHHIISDATSVSILIQEFTALYSGSALPALRIQYKDYAAWQQALFLTEAYTNQEQYWLSKYADGIPVLNLPTDYVRLTVQSFEGERFQFTAGQEMTIALHRFASKTGSTLYMVLLAAYHVLLMKYSGQNDMIVGSPIAGRTHADLERMLGMFVNTLTMRNYPDHLKTFESFVQEVKENALQAYANQDYPFEQLVEKLNIPKDRGRNALIDTMFTLQNVEQTQIELKGLRLSPHDYDSRTTKYDLSLEAIEQSEGIRFSFEYDTKLFTSQTIERMSKHWLRLLQELVANPSIQLGEIQMLEEEEIQRVRMDFNQTKANFPKAKTIHQLFEEQAESTPERVAVVYEDQQITYCELNKRSNQLAHHLRNKGAVVNDRIGLITNRSIDMIVGMIAILKAGGAYVPIDPTYPIDRIEYMLSDSGAQLVIADSSCISIVQKITGCEIIDLSQIPVLSDQNLTSVNQSGDLAYIIYTSGTTGKPKGVMIEHRNVVRLFVHDQPLFDFNEHDTWSMFHSYCFDFSVWEMYGALLFGGKLVVIPKHIAQDSQQFLDVLMKEKVTVLNQTPSAFYNLVQSDLEQSRNDLQLRYVIFGGEALKPAMLASWKDRYPDIRLINMYGITETTVHVTYKEITDSEIESNISNIGRPIPTLTCYVLDDHMKIVPQGVVGELYIGGEGVARGYIHNEALTKEKFVSDPFNPEQRLYRSGDLARWSMNEELEYYGRIDHQVKIRGYRIELSEIETQLLKHPEIREAVVIDVDDSKFLCGYIVSDEELSVADIRAHLIQMLPDYMIPSYFVRVDQIPITSNGKIDRKSLPEPKGSIYNGVEYVAPRNEIESQLVEILQDILELDRIGIDDDFFDLGGNSIQLVRLHMALERENLLPERDTSISFQYRTIAALAGYIQSLPKAEINLEEDVLQ